MTPQQRQFVLLALVVTSAVVIGLIIYFLVFLGLSRQPQIVSPAVTPTSPEAARITNIQSVATDNQPPAAVVAPDNQPPADVTVVARTFAARYATYANQAGADQFDDLALFATKKMQTWLSADTTQTLSDLPDPATAYVMTSQAVAVKVSQLDQAAGRAVVVVSLRRAAESGGEPLAVVNKDLRLSLVRAGARWLVDEAAWQ